jgi:hypothetical protein
LGGRSGEAPTKPLLLLWTPDKDLHHFDLPNLARDIDLHQDGLQVATAHHDRHVRITKRAAKT